MHQGQMVKLDFSMERCSAGVCIRTSVVLDIYQRFGLDEDINSHILKFADDTKIFKEVRNSADCSQLQADLDKLVLWAQKWQIEFNVDKCKVMHVGNRDDGSTYHMEGSELTKVSCKKDLGVWISDDISVLSSAYMPLTRPLEYWV